jgi:hypothetical protein
MRILFYLPAVTSNWLDNLLTPLIRRAAREAEVHIVVPRRWRDTGISGGQLQRWIDWPEIRWHILDGPDHPSFRTAPSEPDEIAAFVNAIGADYIFCRSADILTPQRFSGTVRFLMEGDYPPLLGDGRPHSDRIAITGPDIFGHGHTPLLTTEQRTRLAAYTAPLWESFRVQNRGYLGGRLAYLERANLPTDRPIIAVPLEAESRTNFFEYLYWGPRRNEQFVYHLLAYCGEDCVLAVTPHPLSAIQPPDIQRRMAESLARLAAFAPDRVRILNGPGNARELTRWLIQYSDGVVLRDSKAIATAAFYGKPVLRLSHFTTAEWINTYHDIRPFFDAVRAGRARTAAETDALTWFAYHHANNAFVPRDADQTFSQFLDRVDRPVNPDRWEPNLARHRQDFSGWFAAQTGRAA